MKLLLTVMVMTVFAGIESKAQTLREAMSAEGVLRIWREDEIEFPAWKLEAIASEQREAFLATNPRYSYLILGRKGTSLVAGQLTERGVEVVSRGQIPASKTLPRGSFAISIMYLVAGELSVYLGNEFRLDRPYRLGEDLSGIPGEPIKEFRKIVDRSLFTLQGQEERFLIASFDKLDWLGDMPLLSGPATESRQYVDAKTGLSAEARITRFPDERRIELWFPDSAKVIEIVYEVASSGGIVVRQIDHFHPGGRGKITRRGLTLGHRTELIWMIELDSESSILDIRSRWRSMEIGPYAVTYTIDSTTGQKYSIDAQGRGRTVETQSPADGSMRLMQRVAVYGVLGSMALVAIVIVLRRSRPLRGLQ